MRLCNPPDPHLWPPDAIQTLFGESNKRRTRQLNLAISSSLTVHSGYISLQARHYLNAADLNAADLNVSTSTISGASHPHGSRRGSSPSSQPTKNMAASALAPTVLESIRPENFDEEGLETLRFLFSDTLLFAALDLIDRESVIKYKTPWGGIQYEVHGSTANYSVFPELPGPSPDKKSSLYCTCPAFAYSVLLSRTQVMCKHLLATLLAERLAKCIERSIQPNDIAALAIRQCTS